MSMKESIKAKVDFWQIPFNEKNAKVIMKNSLGKYVVQNRVGAVLYNGNNFDLAYGAWSMD